MAHNQSFSSVFRYEILLGDIAKKVYIILIVIYYINI